jgi:hypothetical protein
MWHVLEHSPAPVSLLFELGEKMSAGGIVAIQVPKYRAEYVIDCHFHFLNRFTFGIVLEKSALSMVGIYDDFDNHYLTVLARKKFNVGQSN